MKATNAHPNQKNLYLKTFLQATRPRTFPLAMASIVCGNALAYTQLKHYNLTHWGIFLLTLWVALSLQILSNLANDYGDGVKGTDLHRDTDSPVRMTIQGYIDAKKFRTLIFIWAWMTFFSGVLLIYLGFDNLKDFLTFLAFGILAIIAAMAYTMGKRPYGYHAMGEISVIIFFGWLGVLGSSYLQTHQFTLNGLFPATACGLLSAAVLYVNNMRDLDGDKMSGKTTIAVLLGRQHMLKGYYLILALAILLYLTYGIQNAIGSLLWIIWLPILIKHIHFLKTHYHNSKQIGSQLKIIVQSTLIINLLFAIGIILL